MMMYLLRQIIEFKDDVAFPRNVIDFDDLLTSLPNSSSHISFVFIFFLTVFYVFESL